MKNQREQEARVLAELKANKGLSKYQLKKMAQHGIAPQVKP